MLTQDEFVEFVDAIKRPITPNDILVSGDIVKAKESVKNEALGYAMRTLTYFEKKRAENG